MLITKQTAIFRAFYANCALKRPLILTWPVVVYQCYFELLKFVLNYSQTAVFFIILYCWIGMILTRNAAFTLHTLILQNLHVNDLLNLHDLMFSSCLGCVLNATCTLGTS